MVVAIVIMSFVIVVLLFFIVMMYSMVGTLNKQIELLDKEQHTQNNDIIELIKKYYIHQEMLLQHIEILKYLVEQDPMLSKKKVIYGGPIGEA